jgi:sulfide dehydrogenase cytochrome subunit
MRLFVATGTAALALLMPTGAAQAQDLQARNLAATCANCHGTNGNALGDMKPLAGMQADQDLAMVADYKSGAQPATVMHQIVQGLHRRADRLIAGLLRGPSPRP